MNFRSKAEEKLYGKLNPYEVADPTDGRWECKDCEKLFEEYKPQFRRFVMCQHCVETWKIVNRSVRDIEKNGWCSNG